MEKRRKEEKKIRRERGGGRKGKGSEVWDGER